MPQSSESQHRNPNNRFESVLSAARQAHQVKAQAAIDARQSRQETFENELSFLMRQEHPQRRNLST